MYMESANPTFVILKSLTLLASREKPMLKTGETLSLRTPWSVVTRADRDAVHALRGFQLDVVVGTVVLQLGRFVDQAILIAEIGFDDAQVGRRSGFGVVVEERAAAGFRGQFRQCFWA